MANFNIDYLVVAGGGGGGGCSGSGYLSGAGGGAGGMRTSFGTGNVNGGLTPVESTLTLATATSYTIEVGQGGAGMVDSFTQTAYGYQGVKGDDSTFHTITSTGGGGGGAMGPSPFQDASSKGGIGGSGGGSGFRNGPTGTGSAATPYNASPVQGFIGGGNLNYSPGYATGGGGGAGGAGGLGGPSPNNGPGGLGLQNAITGTNSFYAGGGGGSTYRNAYRVPGPGGSGIGGDGGGAYPNTAGVGGNGVVNTGSGGGGGNAGTGSVAMAGGSGGSGVVILRYATADVTGYTVTGAAPTETTDGTDTILSFTTVGTGTITFTTPPQPFSGTKVTTPVTNFDKPLTEEGLKIPSGTSSNQPTGVTGMVRNDTTQSSKGSSSAITHYNGTNWRYFENELNTSFNTVIYTGSTSPHAITGIGFQPDLIWIKNRDQADSYAIVDSVRGIISPAPYIASNLIDVENTSTNMPTSVQSDGFTITGNGGRTNTSGEDYVAWCFKAGGLINKAADFNGSSSYITPSSSSTLTGLTKAVSIWIKSDNFTSIGTWPFQQGNGQGIENYIRFYNGSDIQIRWGNQTLTSSGYSTGVWYHIVAQENANGFANFWINGVEIATSASSPLSVTGDTNIGRRLNSSSYQYYFNGQMAQLRLFSSSLDSTQIAQLYNETKVDNSVLNFPSGAGCIAAYPLGENANGVDGLYNGTASNVTFGKPGYLTRNTEGTIESTVSVNNDLGFSIVKYNGNAVSGATVGHGLGVNPELIIVKNLDLSVSWGVWTTEIGLTEVLRLDQTAAATTPATAYFTPQNNTGSVFGLGTNNETNDSSDSYIAYCFVSKPNYSKIGTYIGNGNAAGPTITLGFEPAWLMIKEVTNSGNWRIMDNTRQTTNPKSDGLWANLANAESTSSSNVVDFNSDNFQVVGTGSDVNTINSTYIYLAFANTI